jgi:hypothetical protein
MTVDDRWHAMVDESRQTPIPAGWRSAELMRRGSIPA